MIKYKHSTGLYSVKVLTCMNQVNSLTSIPHEPTFFEVCHIGSCILGYLWIVDLKSER